MSDNNLENEFKSFFGGDDSLYRKLGEEKAQKVLNLLKQMLEQDDDMNKVFKPSPFQKLNLKNVDDLGEPDEIRTSNDNGITSVEKIWKDDFGNVIRTQIESNIDFKSSGNPQEFSFDMPANLGLPMIIGFNPLEMGTNNIFEFLKNVNPKSGKKVKKQRTLEQLLERAVEIENYDLAADVKKLIEYSPEFLAAFKKDMAAATEKEDMGEIKKLTGLFEKHKRDIQQLLDNSEHLFE